LGSTAYEPAIPSLRNDVTGFWTTAFTGFEAAVTHWALLYTAFGGTPEASEEWAIRWAARNGYYPEGYRRRPVERDRIAEIKDQLRVEDVAARLTELRGSGNSLSGRCPFHDDHNPSFVVWPDIQKWRCYGCGLHGDVIDLLDRAGTDG